MKAAHRGGKSQDRGKGIYRVRAEGEKLYIWRRPGRNAGAKAECTVEGMANLGKLRGHNKGSERAGLVGGQDKGRHRGQGGQEGSQHMADGLAEGWAKGRTGIKTWRRARRR